MNGRYLETHSSLLKHHCPLHKMHRHHNDELSIVIQNSVTIDSVGGILELLRKPNFKATSNKVPLLCKCRAPRRTITHSSAAWGYLVSLRIHSAYDICG